MICTLGNFATKLLSGRPDGITKVHGREQEVTLGGTRVLLYPIFHPAAALYTPRMLDVLQADFARLPEILGRETAPPEPPRRRRRRPAGARCRPARPLLTARHEAVVGRPSPIVRRWGRGGHERVGGGDGGARRTGRRAVSRVGDVVGVAGELGAGKTTFVRGACRALGVTSPVASPTFTIGHRYDGRVPVAHLDLYRLDGHRRGRLGRPRALLRWHDCVRRVARARGRLAAPGASDGHARATSTQSSRSIRIESDDDLRL